MNPDVTLGNLFTYLKHTMSRFFLGGGLWDWLVFHMAFHWKFFHFRLLSKALESAHHFYSYSMQMIAVFLVKKGDLNIVENERYAQYFQMSLSLRYQH